MIVIAAAIAVALAGCSAMRQRTEPPGPAPDGSGDVTACLPAVARADAALTVSGDSLSGAAAGTMMNYMSEMQVYGTCTARAALP
jgi:hypothetical protein